MNDIQKAKLGDGEVFARVTEPHRKELLAHCYRMVGSVVEAEDMVQDSLLRAWRNLSQYQESGSLRAWLYRIATNICLDHLRRCKSRELMPAFIMPTTTAPPALTPVHEEIWIEPFPNELLPTQPTNPEALYSTQESINLAFMVALHKLSARNRAVLLLRDVLGWRAKEVAELLDSTESAIHSILKRARKEIQDSDHRKRNKATPEIIDSFRQQYVSAWVNNDVSQLVTLLKEDVLLNMPPLPCWYHGRDYVLAFFGHLPLDGQNKNRWRTVVITVNSQPAVALYESITGQSPHQLFGIQVLEMDNAGISRIDQFITDKNRTLPEPISATWLNYFSLPTTF